MRAISTLVKRLSSFSKVGLYFSLVILGFARAIFSVQLTCEICYYTCKCAMYRTPSNFFIDKTVRSDAHGKDSLAFLGPKI